MQKINGKELFGFNVGDKLYIANKEKGKVLEFFTDCIKIREHDITVHGLVYGLNGKWGIPAEYNTKWLNKRYIFTKKKDAEEWLSSGKNNQ